MQIIIQIRKLIFSFFEEFKFKTILMNDKDFLYLKTDEKK
tara:strand:+ start:379 stop:498 length:120 start_codon:yes stop_codon:yes gene_type:complete